jgi:hypothetical protein
MKFAKILFNVAGIWGVILLVPLYFIFDLIGQQDPPPITHPAFFYGFAGLGLAWQVAFFIIARDPLRFRPMMIPSILEKIGYGGAVVALCAHGRMHGQDLAFGLVDLLFATLFAAAYATTGPRADRLQ